MQRQRPAHDLDEVANLVLSVVLIVVGCWLLAMVAGAVALLAILLTAVVYVPLRVLHLEGRLGGRSALGRHRDAAVVLPAGGPVESSGDLRLPSPRRPADDPPAVGAGGVGGVGGDEVRRTEVG